MENQRITRRQALKRRRNFIIISVSVIVLVISLLVFIFVSIFSENRDKKGSSSDISSSTLQSSSDISSADSSVENSSNDSSESSEVSSIISSETESSEISSSASKLDPEYSNLLLVNGENPLPKNFDYEGSLSIIEDKYLCGWRNQMNSDAMPYATAMIEAAWADGVELYILSPYRSYDTQVTLFNNEVAKWKKTGLDKKAAEEKASTVVARPGTSEHHTGLAIDFNSVEDSFEDTKMFKWLSENAQDYGFIHRYTAEKQPITGVIHESWHWRFVGINEAKKIKASGLCLEEYLEANKTSEQ